MAIIIKLVALAGFAIMFVWTLITGREQVPLTDRTQVIAVSEEETAALGAQAFQEVLSRNQVVRSGPDAERVRIIAQRIAAEVDEITETDYRWEVVLLNAPDVNAFALPGGKVAVLSGLLSVARTDDQLAAVIGHEMGMSWRAMARSG
jgi:predicted Zn-dependent protease